jgi:hypothetical protein
VDDYDWFFRRRLGFFFNGFGSQTGGYLRIAFDDLLFQPLGSNLIKRAGRNLGGGNAQFLGLYENFFVLETKFLCNVVNTNGHKLSHLPPTGLCNSPSWLKSQPN